MKNQNILSCYSLKAFCFNRWNISLWVTAIVFGCVSGCSSLDNITVTKSGTAEIQGASLAQQLSEDLGFSTFSNFDIKSSQELQNEGIDAEDIDTIFVQSLSLEVISPTMGQDLSFIDQVEFFIDSDNLDNQRIAFGGPFSSGSTMVFLSIEAVDLQPYVAESEVTISAMISGQAPDEDTTIEAVLKLDVDIDVSDAVF